MIGSPLDVEFTGVNEAIKPLSIIPVVFDMNHDPNVSPIVVVNATAFLCLSTTVMCEVP